MAKWYAGALIYRYNGSELEVLVIDTKSIDPQYSKLPKQMKFVGGTEKFPDSNIWDTLRREVLEETNLVISSDAKQLLIHHVAPSTEHFKNFYLLPIESFSGEMRKKDKTMENDWMSAPRFIPASLAFRIIRQKDHLKALEKAIEYKKARVNSAA